MKSPGAAAVAGVMLHVLNALLGAALLGGSAVAWFGLPEVIPVHFDLGGHPDRWAEATFASWFGPPLLALALVAGLYLLGRWLPARPTWVNLPRKDRYLALFPEEREPVNDALRAIFHWTSTFVLVLFCVVQVAVFRQAEGFESSSLVVLVLVITLSGGPAVAVMGLVRTQNALDEAWERHRGPSGPAPPGSPT